MSIADTSTSHARLGVVRFLAVRLGAFALWLHHRSAFAVDRSRLHAMPDHVLRDIGLTRDGIDEALRDVGANMRPPF